MSVRLLSTVLLLASSAACSAHLETPFRSDPPDDPPKEPEPETIEIEIAGETFELELALTYVDRASGLGDRDKIDDDGGMLFAYRTERERSYWMLDCLIDMDVMYIDRRGRVVMSYEMKAEPPRGPDESREAYERRLRRYPSLRPVPFAIELKAGTIERLGIERGDVIEFDYAAVRARAE